MVQRINAGSRMSDVVIHNGTVYLSGKVPANPHDGIQAQTRSVLATIDGLLEKAGTSKANLLRADIYLTDMTNFAAMNEVWDQWVQPGSPPARTTVECKLANPAYLIEITVVAALAA